MSHSPVKPIVIKNVKVTYITTKTDLYKNENSYFKISKKDIDAKFNKVSVDGFKLLWFAGDDGKYILKVKFKNVKLPDMIQENMYVTNISFKYYNIDNNEGYYVNTISRILNIEKCQKDCLNYFLGQVQ